MHLDLLRPTNEEIDRKMLDDLRHSLEVEYYAAALGIESPDDNERPHDLEGRHSKYDLPVLERLALEQRTQTREVNALVLEGINMHRGQYHHRMWNSDNAPDGAMRLAAVDSICSKLQPRIKIEGGSHDGIIYSLDDGRIDGDLRGTPKQIDYMVWALNQMRQVRRPDLQSVTSLISFPNIGIPRDLYHKTINRTRETIDAATQKGYVIIPDMARLVA